MEQNQVERQEVPQEVFERFDAYDFAHDEDYQSGLETILSSDRQISKDIILMAKTFYYTKKVEPIDYDNYKAWKAPVRPLSDADIDEAMRTQSNPTAIGLGSADATPPVIVSGPSISNDPDMPYPASFADIVEMIKSGKPVPGIKDIPDKVAEGSASTTNKAPSKKPWETDGSEIPSLLDSMTADP